ncbi:MAG: hypothetical protein FWF68_03570 [Spirochaetes bacterium]|nr:hypothetical protein [Spirochaetota bacterium]
MKKTIKLIGIIAIAAIIGLSMTACGGGEATPSPVNLPSVGYESKDSAGNIYLLEITKNASGRAAYTPANGDTYELTIISNDVDIKKSKGTVTVSGSGFTLTPAGSSTPFNVTTSGENMTGITGTITLTDNSTKPAPSSVNPVIVNPRTIEFKAGRWGGTLYDDKAGGENWAADDLKLEDFTSVKPREGYVYRFQMSGTPNKPLKWFGIGIHSLRGNNWDDDGFGEKYEWAGGPAEFNLSKSFDETFGMQIWVNVKEPAYFYINMANTLWQRFPNDGDQGQLPKHYHDKLPANIPNGEVMARITNFRLRLINITLGS